MKKIGLIFDSACGLSKEQALKLDVGFIPLNISINDTEYKAGINITRDELYSSMENKDTLVKTSSPTGESIQEALDMMLEKYEKVLYIGISNKWSGTQNAVKTIIENFEQYKDRVIVYDSWYSSPWIGLYIEELKELVEEYESIDKIITTLNVAIKYAIAYLSPGSIWWFYKGGRITKMQYILGSVAKINPVLKYIDGAIDQHGAEKARGVSKAMIKMTDGIRNDIQKLNLSKDIYKIIALKTNNNELLEQLKQTIEVELAIPREELVIDQLSPEQIAHMGPNSFGLGVYVSLKNIIKANLK